jgi:hypothetical protein
VHDNVFCDGDDEQVGTEVTYMTYCELNSQEAERRIREVVVDNGGSWKRQIVNEEQAGNDDGTTTCQDVPPEDVIAFVKGVVAEAMTI